MTPAPNAYVKKGFMETAREKRQGWTFGESRSKVKDSGPVPTHLKNNPGYFSF